MSDIAVVIKNPSLFSGVIKKRDEDDPAGTATCDNGHEFKIANFHQRYRGGRVKYEITGYCFGCKNSVLVIRDEIPKGANRDYRVLGRVTSE